MKKVEGITLIALVVTIIVLLILAGVTIAMILGNDGIFKKAETAKEKTTESQEIEIIKLSMNTIKTNDWENKVVKKELVTAEELKGEIERHGYTAEVNGADNLTVKYTNSGSSENTYLVAQEGTVTKVEPKPEIALIDMYKAGENCTQENCTDSAHLHIGDYVNYKPVVGTNAKSLQSENGYGEQSYTVQEGIKWRVIGINENRTQVLLTSGLPVKRDGDDPTFYFRGAESYLYSEQELDKICSIFGTGEGADKARSIRVEDVNDVLEVIKQGDIVYLKEDASKKNIDILNCLGKDHKFSIGEYTPEGFLIGEALKEELILPQTAYAYMETSLTTNNRRKETIFKGTADANPYWLASPGVNDRGFNTGCVGAGFVINGRWIDNHGLGQVRNLAVRPIVVLKANITTKTIQKIADQTDTPW